MNKPLGLYKRDNSSNWYFRCEYLAKEYRRSTGTPDLAEAKQIRDRFVRQLRAAYGEPSSLSQTWDDRCTAALEDPGSWLHKIKWSTRKRNKKNFDLNRGISTENLYRLARASNGLCDVCGLPFEFNGDEPVPGPFAISIDRITAGEPYSDLNCRFVLRGINYAMHDWGEDAFWQIARGAIARELLLK